MLQLRTQKLCFAVLSLLKCAVPHCLGRVAFYVVSRILCCQSHFMLSVAFYVVSRILCCQSPDETYFRTKSPATLSHSTYCMLGITQGRRTRNMKWQAACITLLLRHTTLLKYTDISSALHLFYNNHNFCWLVRNITNISKTVTRRNQWT